VGSKSEPRMFYVTHWVFTKRLFGYNAFLCLQSGTFGSDVGVCQRTWLRHSFESELQHEDSLSLTYSDNVWVQNAAVFLSNDYFSCWCTYHPPSIPLLYYSCCWIIVMSFIFTSITCCYDDLNVICCGNDSIAADKKSSQIKSLLHKTPLTMACVDIGVLTLTGCSYW